MHQRQGQQNHGWDQGRHHQPGPHTKEQQQNKQHHAHCLQQVHDKLVDRSADALGLVVDLVDFDAVGQFVHQPLHSGLNARVDLQHIAAVAVRDRHHQRRLAVEPRQHAWRVFVVGPDFSDLTQGQCMVTVDRNEGVRNCINAGVAAVDFDHDAALPQPPAPGRNQAVATDDGVANALGGQAVFSEPLGQVFDHDLLGLLGLHSHTPDPIDLQQPVFQSIRLLLQRSVGKACACDGVDDPIHVAEVVIDLGANDRVGQCASGVVHFTSKVVPNRP